jgi:hypothetical protein
MPKWTLTVEETFHVTGRGAVVVGTFDGRGHNGDRALIRTPTPPSPSTKSPSNTSTAARNHDSDSCSRE